MKRKIEILIQTPGKLFEVICVNTNKLLAVFYSNDFNSIGTTFSKSDEGFYEVRLEKENVTVDVVKEKLPDLSQILGFELI